MNKYYTSYKGIWYKWIEEDDRWCFSDTEDGHANVMIFSNKWRWDEGYNKFLEELEKLKKEYDERRKNEEVKGLDASPIKDLRKSDSIRDESND